jgi:hypothetical protein
MLRGGIGAAMAARRDEFTKGGTVSGGQVGVGHEGKMQDAQRRRYGREGPGMHFAQNSAAQGMRFKRHGLSFSKIRRRKA